MIHMIRKTDLLLQQRRWAESIGLNPDARGQVR